MNERSTFRAELDIVPGIAWALAIIVFLCALVGGVGVAMHCAGGDMQSHHDPSHCGVFLVAGLFGGFLLGCWVLLLGYVNRDAARRGMGPVLWTLVCIFVPNCLGFLIYFLVRKPLVQFCPQCGQQVNSDFRFCPKCHYALAPTCASCGRAVSRDYVFCPYCGHGAGVSAQPAAPNPAQS